MDGWISPFLSFPSYGLDRTHVCCCCWRGVGWLPRSLLSVSPVKKPANLASFAFFRVSASNLTLLWEKDARAPQRQRGTTRSIAKEARDDRELDESNDRVGFLLLGQEKTNTSFVRSSLRFVLFVWCVLEIKSRQESS